MVLALFAHLHALGFTLATGRVYEQFAAVVGCMEIPEDFQCALVTPAFVADSVQCLFALLRLLTRRRSLVDSITETEWRVTDSFVTALALLWRMNDVVAALLSDP